MILSQIQFIWLLKVLIIINLPKIQWLLGDESYRPVVPGRSSAHLRSVARNGSLLFHPFPTSQYEGEVHGLNSYR